jgi:hypothetical protein
MMNGVVDNLLAKKDLDPAEMNLKSGTIHVWIDYHGPSGLLEVRLSKTDTRPDQPELSYVLPNKLTQILDSDQVYVGFTASTGGAYQNHDIKSWYFTNRFDPIDVQSKTYKQTPNSYTIASVTLEDGTVELTIAPAGGDVNHVPLTIHASNGALIAPTAADTGEEGSVKVIASSPDNESMTTTVTVTGPEGVTSTQDVFIPGRTEAPLEENILAVTTDAEVEVLGVPAGAQVTVYDHEGNILASQPNVNGGKLKFTGLNGLSTNHQIAVTFQTGLKKESTKTLVYPKVRTVLDPSNIVANATTKQVLVRNTPAGAVVHVYDLDENQIAQGTNTLDAAGDIVIGLPSGVNHKEKLYMTMTAPGELQSWPVQVEALAMSSALDEEQIATDGTADRITVQQVPAGATVIIYDVNDNELGRGANNAAAAADVTVDELGLDFGMSVKITLTETHKLESDPVTLAVTFTQSDAPALADIDANATTSVVTVQNVPANTKVTVYDASGHELDAAVNSTASPAEVSLTFSSPRLEKDQPLDVTLTEPRKTESKKTRVTAYYEKSAKLDEEQIVANATSNTVTVTGVNPGATIIVYDAVGSAVLGTEHNAQAAVANLTITLTPPIAAGDALLITNTEQYHNESEPVAVIAREKTAPLPEARIRADATADRMTFMDIPAGAELIVYDEQNVQMASATNSHGQVSDLALDIHLTQGQILRVTIQEPDKLVSDPTVMQAREQTASLQLTEVLDIDVASGTVKIGNVPPGATVIIYDQDGHELGRRTNGGAVNGEIEIPGLSLETVETLLVSYTEPDKYESEKLTVNIGSATETLIHDAVKKLTIGYQDKDTWESVTKPIFVVSAGEHNTAVSWTSSKPEVIKITEPNNGIIEAEVYRQDQDESVILTATVSKNGQEKIRTFLVIVKSKGLNKEVPTEKYRYVKVTGGENAEVSEELDITRVTLSKGTDKTVIDKVVFDGMKAAQFVGKPESKNSVSSIYVDETPAEKADEFAVEVTEAAVRLLSDNGNALEVRTDFGGILIENGELGNMARNSLDLYFRLVPVKNPDEQQQMNSGIRDTIRNEANIQVVTAGKDVNILGASLKVETNYSNYKTTLILYFEKNGIQVPSSNVHEFLDSLRVYIEHSDGTSDLKIPNPVYEGGIPAGVSIEIDKFSTFTILQLQNPQDDGPSPAAQETPQSGMEQIVTATIDQSRQAIVLELDREDSRLDTAGFYVTARGQALGVAEVAKEGRYVTIRLSEMLPAGYQVTVHYSPQNGSMGSAHDLQPFSGISMPNPGYHPAYILGFEDGSFRPDNPITRAEIAAILARNMNLPASAAHQGLYPDVPSSHWAWPDIERVTGAGLMIGDTDGRFRPQDAITRAEMVMIAAKWMRADLSRTPAHPFRDVAQSHWAATAIAAAHNAGIITGFTDETFGPDAVLTRAQAVAIMNRLLGRVPIAGTSSSSFPDVSISHWAYREIEEAAHGHYFMYDDDGHETQAEGFTD